MRHVEKVFRLTCRFFQNERKKREYAHLHNIISVAEKERIFQNIMKELRKDEENNTMRLAYTSDSK